MRIKIMILALLLATLACSGRSPKQQEEMNSSPLPASRPATDQAQKSADRKVVDGKMVDVKFAPGQSATTYNDLVLAGTRNLYYVTARAGQEMAVQINSMTENSNARFTIFDRQAQLTFQQSTGGYWIGRLSNTGDYIIDVLGGASDTEYELTISVK